MKMAEVREPFSYEGNGILGMMPCRLTTLQASCIAGMNTPACPRTTETETHPGSVKTSAVLILPATVANRGEWNAYQQNQPCLDQRNG